MTDATAKFPTTAAALADFGGEMPGIGENEWTANGATTAGAAAPFSLVVNEAIAARVPTTGWLTTANNEILHYSSYNAGTKTFTIDARALQDTVAAAIDSGSAVGQWMTKRAFNQILAELIALETAALGGIHNPNLCLNSDFARRTVFGLAMPEVFADLSGTTKIDGGAAGSVAANVFTQGAANNEYAWAAGSFVWRDGRASATFKAVSTTGTYTLRWRVSSTDYIVCTVINGSFYLRKVIASGAEATVTSVVQALTLNRWYWLELEKQGTTIIVKMYDTGGTVPGVTKASSTLLQTLTGTVADASVQVGAHISITSDQAAAQWGGIATGNGGVYVETWLPESTTVAFTGTLGGQAIGYDESADAGPLGKQWAMRAYIPATSRAISLSTPITPGSLNNGATYAQSIYVKQSGLGGAGVMTRFRFYDRNTALGVLNIRDVDDGAEVAWTRKSTTYGVAGTTWSADMQINPASTRTGTSFFQLPQLEQGSAATAWRNAPADDAPIVTQVATAGSTITSTSNTFAELDPRDLAIDFFAPWDCSVVAEFDCSATGGTLADQIQFDITLDGVALGGANGMVAVNAPGVSYLFGVCARTRTTVAAGKHRFAVTARNLTAARAFTVQNTIPHLIITATRGK